MTIDQIPPPFNVAQAYQQVFGHVRPPYPELVAESKTYGVSPVGTFKAIKGSFQFKSVLGANYTMPTKLDDWQLPNEPTISVHGGKRVIDTMLNRLDPLTGKIERKNVLEEVGLNNYEVRIRGIIFNEDDFDSYPVDDVSRFREIIEKAGSIKVDNDILRIQNITRIAILNIDWFEVKGYVGAQAYELHCLQDENLSLEQEINEPERL